MSDRELVLDAVKDLPDDFSIRQIVDELLLLDEVKERLAKSERGVPGVPHTDVAENAQFMDYKIIWDDQAIKELEQAVRFIAPNNPAAARKTGEAILKKLEVLGSFPRLGKVYSKLNRDDVREIPVPPHRIFYHIKDTERTVRILKVWHGSRQEPEIK